MTRGKDEHGSDLVLPSNAADTGSPGWRGDTHLSPFRIGDRLGDRYVLKSLLGRGGMGEVFEVWDDELEINVALKALFGLDPHPERLRLLRREVLLARAVAHPNVCRVYDLGRHTSEEGVA